MLFGSIICQNLSQPTFHNLDVEFFGVKSIKACKVSAFHNGVWFITDNGLGLFNGYITKTYSSDSKEGGNKPLSNKLMELYEDKSGILWFGYQDKAALTSFNPSTETFTHYENDSLDKNSFPSEAVSRFLEDSEGRLWVSTWGKGIFRLSKDRKSHSVINQKSFSDPNFGLRTDAIRDMYEMGPGKILVTYFHEQPIGYPGIYDTKKNTVTPFPIEEYQGNLSAAAFQEVKHVLTICHFVHKDKYDKLWFGTYSGLAYIDLKNKTCKRISGRVFNENFVQNLENTVNFIEPDPDHLWVSTGNSGIMVVNLKTTKAFYHVNNENCNTCVGGNAIYNFSKDKDGNIWVTHNNYGISIYSPYKKNIKVKEWANLGVTFSNASHQTMPLNKLFVRNNKTIFMSSNSGFSIYDYANDTLKKVINPFKFASGNPDNVQTVYGFRLSNNKLFFSSSIIGPLLGKPCSYDLKTDEFFYMKNKEHSFGSIYFTNDTSKRPTYVLSNSYNNLCYYNNNGSLDTFHLFEDRYSPQPGYGAVLNNGKWVFSKSSGSFIIFDSITKKSIKFSRDQKESDVYFMDSLILSYHYNKKNTLWITTPTAIYSLDINTYKIKKWNSELGFETVYVPGLVEDKYGNIWFTKSNSFYHYDFKNKKLTNYNKAIGISTMGFGHQGNLHSMGTDGEYVFFPSLRGLLYFSVDNLQLPKSIPEINIYNISTNDSSLSQADFNLFKQGKLDIQYNQNNISLELNTNQLFTPTPNLFNYKLLGLNDNWVNNETSNKIKLQNLPSGTYTLIVNCVNSYNITSKNLLVSFTINKPFWKTLWFILSIILAVIVTFVYIIKSREKTLQKKQEVLEKIVEERTQEVVAKAKEVNHQKELVEEKQKEIVDSIIYAQRIQNAILASKTLLNKCLKNYFIYFNPKDIVSGDFYWATSVGNKFYFIVADSTGHGVPGAFMSLLNISFLNEAINEKLIEKPGDILNYVRQRLIQSLAEDGSAEGGKDGMDCSLLCLHLETNLLEYACAHNSIILIRNNQLIELKSDRMPVGKSPKESTPFTNHEIYLENNDVIYIVTDGYADQFGGETGKKMKSKNLKNYLLEISSTAISEQHVKLKTGFEKWKGDLEQIDDVTIVGIKI